MSMTQTNETRRSGGAAGLSSLSCLAADGSETAPKLAITQAENDSAPGQFAKQPFPSFFELVTENAAGPIRRAAVYLRILAELSSVEDYEGYCEAGEKFLDAGRDFAKSLNLLKTPAIFSNELADRLEEKACALHNLADLTEMEASRIRSVVTL
jgi:hypothetical protein